MTRFLLHAVRFLLTGVCPSAISDRVRRSYWNSAGEIREMVYRNMIEFDAEEYNWEKVAEVGGTHTYIHTYKRRLEALWPGRSREEC